MSSGHATCAVFFSGGKDSMLALDRSLRRGLPVTRLITLYDEASQRVLLGALADLRREGIATLIFGDIHLADVRAWYEDRVRAAGFDHLEPLWGEDPATLANEVVERGYEAVITCIEDATAKPEWLGQTLSQPLLQSFAATGIDVCGERGEYHTFVVDGPLFTSRVPITTGTVHSEGGFRQLDMALASSAPEAVSDGQAT
jgi:uncharacterized protein (TIGR00290 family)